MPARTIALAGIGKIALDQHVPAIAASPDWELAATVSRNGSVDGVEAFRDMESLLKARPDIDVVSLCMPPVPRFAYAKAALEAGKHVMLEKPPGATIAECHALLPMAKKENVCLYASWHSREADRVPTAERWLQSANVESFEIIWKEDVRRWHPGQEWIFEPGGLGVFDPGINALSILTRILPVPVHLTKAVLEVPANRQTPIAASLVFSGENDLRGTAAFDWRQEGDQTWTIKVKTDKGELVLTDGGAGMSVDGVDVPDEEGNSLMAEYPRLYANFARLIETNSIDFDLRPLELVADAFLVGERRQIEPFAW